MLKFRGNVQKVTGRTKRTGVNAVRVKSLSMYSNIISSRPHYACDVTPVLSLDMSFPTGARETTGVLERRLLATLEIAVDQERRVVNIIINGKV